MLIISKFLGGAKLSIITHHILHTLTGCVETLHSPLKWKELLIKKKKKKISQSTFILCILEEPISLPENFLMVLLCTIHNSHELIMRVYIRFPSQCIKYPVKFVHIKQITKQFCHLNISLLFKKKKMLYFLICSLQLTVKLNNLINS